MKIVKEFVLDVRIGILDAAVSFVNHSVVCNLAHRSGCLAHRFLLSRFGHHASEIPNDIVRYFVPHQ